MFLDYVAQGLSLTLGTNAQDLTQRTEKDLTVRNSMNEGLVAPAGGRGARRRSTLAHNCHAPTGADQRCEE